MIHRGGSGGYRWAGGLTAPRAFTQVNGAPTFVSAEIGNVSTVVVVVTFSQNVAATGSDYISGITINVNGSGATISSGVRQTNQSIVHYTLSTAVVAGDTVTIAYDAGSGYIAGLATFTAQSVTNNVSSLLTGLYGYWKLDETTGTRADSSPSANDLADSGSTGYVVGKIGNAANLTGGTHLSHADAASLRVFGTSFTVDGWLYLNSVAALQVIVGKDLAAGADREWVLFWYTDGYLYFQVYDAAGAAASVSCTTFGTLSIHNWYYFRCWRDIADDKIYISVNGSVADSAAGKAIPALAAPFQVGCYGSPAQYPLTSYVDELGFWKKILSPTEAAARYAGNTWPFRASDTAAMDNLVCEGDSISTTGITPYPTRLAALYASAAERMLTNIALSGDTASNIAATEGATADACYHAQYKRNIAILLAGTNDIGTNGDSAATVWGNLKTWCSARKATGFTTVLLTLLPRNYPGDAGDVMTRINALNVLIRGGDTSIDKVVDIAADVNLSDPDDAYYYVDKLHPTDAGLAIIASLVKAAL